MYCKISTELLVEHFGGHLHSSLNKLETWIIVQVLAAKQFLFSVRYFHAGEN